MSGGGRRIRRPVTLLASLATGGLCVGYVAYLVSPPQRQAEAPAPEAPALGGAPGAGRLGLRIGAQEPAPPPQPPAAPRAPPIAAAPAPAPPPPAAASESPPASAPSPSAAGVRAQVGAYETAELAERQWGRLTEELPAETAGRRHLMEVAQANGKTFVRLQVEGFATRDAAKSFCAALKAKGRACFVR